MKLVIVESPAKAKTIHKYLGSGYKILASMGHVRDLPSKPGSIEIENDFAMHYQIKDESKKHVDNILSAARESDQVFLASDPDREGEAIAWNIMEVLLQKKAITEDKIYRISFIEITPNAVKKAILNPRRVDLHLVDAQKSRLTMDYLVGFNISPVLWRRLPGSKSAGRVQSVALRLIAEREMEIKAFIPKEYWSIEVHFLDNKKTIIAQVNVFQNKKIDREYPTNKDDAEQIKTELLKSKTCIVSNVLSKDFKQNPYPPLITSSLQQEASRKFGFPVKRTMQIAQKLYEGIQIENKSQGLITYMRTDGVNLSAEAIIDIRSIIGEIYPDCLPKKPILYKSKIRNAQEAHEAIRPTDISKKPETIKSHLPEDEFKIYQLIWCRAVASQMSPAIKTTKTIELQAKSKDTKISLSGTKIKFASFLSLYSKMQNIDGVKKETETNVPDWEIGEEVKISDILTKQHFTIAPPRLNEASLIQKMEELGIGRPSTYSSIVSIIQNRGYVDLIKKQFHTSTRGMLVFALLKHFFRQYVEYNFTADLEEKLDKISNGEHSRSELLSEFWKPFYSSIEEFQQKEYKEFTKGLNEELEDYIFTRIDDKIDNKCQKCKEGTMELQVGKFGAYISCNKYPDCNNRVSVNNASDTDNINSSHPEIQIEDGNKILSLKHGQYGPYVEVLEGDKKKNISILKNQEINEETIKLYASLPRKIGIYPKYKKEISANIGRFGPYVLCNGVYATIKAPELFTIDLETAIKLLEDKIKKQVLFEHPDTKETIKVMKGRFGPYIKYKNQNIPMKEYKSPQDITIKDALAAIDKNSSKSPKTTKAKSKTVKPKTTKAKSKTTRAKSRTVKPKTTKKKK